MVYLNYKNKTFPPPDPANDIPARFKDRKTNNHNPLDLRNGPVFAYTESVKGTDTGSIIEAVDK